MPVDKPRSAAPDTALAARPVIDPRWASPGQLEPRELMPLGRDTAFDALRELPLSTRVATARSLLDGKRDFDAQAALVRLVEAAPRETAFALYDAGLFDELYVAIKDHGDGARGKVFDGSVADAQLWQRLTNTVFSSVRGDRAATEKLATVLSDAQRRAFFLPHTKAAVDVLVREHATGSPPAPPAPRPSAPTASGVNAAHPQPAPPSAQSLADGVASIHALLDRGAALSPAEQLSVVRLIEAEPKAMVRTLAERGLFGLVYGSLDKEPFLRLVKACGLSVKSDAAGLEDMVVFFTLAEKSLVYASANKAEVELTLRELAEGKEPSSVLMRLGLSLRAMFDPELRHNKRRT